MSKRDREDARNSAEPDSGPNVHWAVRAVLNTRDLVRLIARCPAITCMDLWNLYQSCSGTLRTLADDPEVEVIREARVNHNGDLYVPLKRALQRGDVRLSRCLCAFLASDGRGRGKIGALACGLCMDYVEVVANQGERLHNLPSLLLCWSLNPDNISHFRAVQKWNQERVARNVKGWETVKHWEAMLAAISLGLVDIAVEMGRAFMPDVEWSDWGEPWLTQDYQWKSTAALDFAAIHWPASLQSLVANPQAYDVMPNLAYVQWIVKYARRCNVPIDYRHWYGFCKASDFAQSSNMRKTLRWLRPLKQRQLE